MTNILTGWINTASDYEAAAPQIKRMLALTPEAELNQQLFISPFLVCAGSQKSSIEYGQCILILYGAPSSIRGEQLWAENLPQGNRTPDGRGSNGSGSRL